MRRSFLSGSAASSSMVMFALFILASGPVASLAQSDAAANTPTPTPTQKAMAADFTVEQLFRDFIHYAKMGQFRAADSSAKTLLVHPDLNPAEVAELADRDRGSIETIQTLIKNSSIPDSAAQVMKLIERGRFMLRHDRERLTRAIEDLGGTPQQELFAIKGLIDGGEYSVPLMIAALQDPAKKEIWPRIIQALSKLEKEAVGPMVQALTIQDNAIRQYLVRALGDIGYPHSIPYLRRTMLDATSTPETKESAQLSIQKIEQLAGRTFPGTADESFVTLSERYYDEDEVVRADTRLETANVWYWDSAAQGLNPIKVPTKIFGAVMAMRSAEQALVLRNDSAPAISLWLAANIRREARLGMNIESGDPNEKGEDDATRPPNFPRALYFTMAAGPRYAHQVLARALGDTDSAVALGAIEALRLTAGESSLVGMDDARQPLAMSLKFPDLVVRIRAALALGAALPVAQFPDSELVVPVLATTLGQTGREQFLVVDADRDNANRIAGLLRDNGADAIVESSFLIALGRARTDFQGLAGVVISTDVSDPDTAGSIAQLRSEFKYSKTPVIVLGKPAQELMAKDLATKDAYVEAVSSAADEAALIAALERVRTRTGQMALNSEMASGMALQAATTLRRIVEHGRTVLDARPAAPALIGALSSPDERLQTSAASALALINAPEAQRAIAHVALSSGNSVSLRVAAFSSLSESARTHGSQLEDSQIAELGKLAAKENDLIIRTAASQSLGAINLASSQASEIIRSFHAK